MYSALTVAPRVRRSRLADGDGGGRGVAVLP